MLRTLSKITKNYEKHNLNGEKTINWHQTQDEQMLLLSDKDFKETKKIQHEKDSTITKCLETNEKKRKISVKK